MACLSGTLVRKERNSHGSQSLNIFALLSYSTVSGCRRRTCRRQECVDRESDVLRVSWKVAEDVRSPRKACGDDNKRGMSFPLCISRTRLNCGRSPGEAAVDDGAAVVRWDPRRQRYDRSGWAGRSPSADSVLRTGDRCCCRSKSAVLRSRIAWAYAFDRSRPSNAAMNVSKSTGLASRKSMPSRSPARSTFGSRLVVMQKNGIRLRIGFLRILSRKP